MARLELYRFRFFDPIRGRWSTAKYRATREEIAGRHQQFEILGEPEIRDVLDPTRLNASHLLK